MLALLLVVPMVWLIANAAFDHPAPPLLIALASGIAIAFIAGLDGIFWRIRRAHDLGWAWWTVLTPHVLIFGGCGLVFAVFVFDSPAWIKICAMLTGAAAFVIAAVIAMRIEYKVGDLEPNRYGPPPIP